MAKKGRPRGIDSSIPELGKEENKENEVEYSVNQEEETIEQSEAKQEGKHISIGNQWELVSDSELKKYQEQGIVAGYDPKTKMALLNR